MPMKIHKYLIFIILFFAFFLRGYKIETLPSLNPDEAALGYNAYSLLQTGKDEHGISWPLHFKSFGDFKPGGYIYLDLPFVKILGLTPLAVRLPNLILSVLSIYIIYRLILLTTNNISLSLLSALVLALNPWHIHFSRGAWESSTSLFFIILGVYWLYLYLLKQKDIYLFLFIIPLSLSFYIYHSARIFVPCLIVIIFLLNFKKLFQPKIILTLLIGALITLPVFISFMKNGGATRFNGVGLTADYGPTSRSEELINQHFPYKILYKFIHNKRILYALSWSQKYFSHFDLNFLFVNGDEVPRSKSPEIGQFYQFELVFLIFGIIYLLKTNLQLTQLIFPWLLTSPLASSLTFQAPSALRALALTIPVSIFIASGIYYVYRLIHRQLLIIFLILLYIFSLAYFLDAYFVHAPKRYSFAWNRGFSEIIPFIESNKSNYQNIYLTDKYDQPYILYLFFSKYPPSKIQSQITLSPPDKFGFSTVTQIDNITFKVPDIIPPDSLVIDSADFQLTGQSFKIYTR